VAAPLRVLHVVDSLRPGGLENGVVNVAARLPAAEFEVHVACLTDLGAFAARLPRPESAVALGKGEGFSLKVVARLSALIRQVCPQVLHPHNLGPLVYTALASCGGLRVPILHGEHGQLDKYTLTPRRLAQRRLTYRACWRVHTVSTGLRDDLVAHGFPARKIFAIRNGVDADRFHPPADRLAVRRQLGLPERAWPHPVLGITGRFHEFKGHLVLIEAIEKLCAEGWPGTLLIVGDQGSAREAVVARLQSSAWRDRLHWVGHQDRPEPFYQAMDLMVFPSSHEGLSNAVLEAMASGVPVLGHSACGNAEVITSGQDGFLAEVGTVETLLQALQPLLADPARLAVVGQTARQKAVRELSLDAMVAAYARAYRAAAERDATFHG
jgi:glycosyltransferase involved in cell wall biosynthesis